MLRRRKIESKKQEEEAKYHVWKQIEFGPYNFIAIYTQIHTQYLLLIGMHFVDQHIFFTCECLLITVGWTVLELSKYSVYPAKWIQSIFIHYRILYLPMEFGTLTNASSKLYKLWSQKWICVLEFSEEGERDKDGGVRVTVYGNVYHWLWDW